MLQRLRPGHCVRYIIRLEGNGLPGWNNLLDRHNVAAFDFSVRPNRITSGYAHWLAALNCMSLAKEEANTEIGEKTF
jgi:hypothetical protein